jgi:phosphoenolpyruvate phosphomutase
VQRTSAHPTAPGPVAGQDKFQQMRELLTSTPLDFLMEAHNGISARIVEEAGFRGIWASGLTISASLGLRDNNEASWTQVLDVLEFMSDATSVPILLDGDTGYGNFNNMQRLVRKLEQRHVGGVCIEDKLFPKANSLLHGERQALADVDEFAGKIKAGKDAQRNDTFCIVARCEAFVAGWNLGEAVRRAEAYRRAGADAIVVHSAMTRPDEVLAFCREWGGRSPIVIIPTSYHTTRTDVFRENGISVVIWANHLMRAAIKAMQEAAVTVHADECTAAIQGNVVSMQEVFRLQAVHQLEHAEALYLPHRNSRARAVVLAASRGAEMGALTEDYPKSMISVAGRPLLEHITTAYRAAGVSNITVVRGYKKEAVTVPHVAYIDNENFDSGGELTSLDAALAVLPPGTDTLIVSYGDVLFRKHVPEMLLEDGEEFAIMVDTNWRESVNRCRAADYVTCSSPYSRRCQTRDVWLRDIAADIPEPRIHGEWMGFLRCRGGGVELVQTAVAAALARTRQATMQSLFRELLARDRRIHVIYTTGHWLDIDSVEDVATAETSW